MVSVHFVWHSLLFTKFLTEVERRQAFTYILLTGISLNKSRHTFKFRKSKTPLTGTWQFSSVTQSCPALCDSVICSMPGCLSITNSQSPPKPMSLSRTGDPAISSSVVPFSSCPQSFPASRFFQMSQFFASGGQSIGVSASTSALPVNTQDSSPLEWTGWISLQSKGLSRSAPTSHFKSINSLVLSFLHSPTLTSIHDYWKNHSLD